jgi:hypothetical protein
MGKENPVSFPKQMKDTCIQTERSTELLTQRGGNRFQSDQTYMSFQNNKDKDS